MYTRIFIEPDPSTLKNPVAVIGLPGIANVGRISVETLIHELGAEIIMHIFSDDIPSQVFVRDGVTSVPKSSLYLYRSAPDEPHDLLILTGDYQPTTNKGVFEFAEFVVQKFASFQVKTVFALAAYEQDYKTFLNFFPSPPRVYISASSEEMLNELADSSETITMNHGVINGANGFIPGWASTMYNMESACLLGETMGMIKMDYRAAKRVLDVFSNFVGLKSTFESIAANAERVNELIEWAKSELEKKESTPEEGEHPSDRYIG